VIRRFEAKLRDISGDAQETCGVDLRQSADDAFVIAMHQRDDSRKFNATRFREDIAIVTRLGAGSGP